MLLTGRRAVFQAGLSWERTAPLGSGPNLDPQTIYGR
eukprot:CAMPEP_0195052300 /NCGR_PEP_ID=MMETSP0448-20130528/1668_1 /TAXON_ID=66468 /ORGANISM="Heterocapsa triquestra, Strain CCMP 448" /LENGTH=36 /DNA_ID= /DNA_START= /DNA_END= /DNA_ORIENTATION=